MKLPEHDVDLCPSDTAVYDEILRGEGSCLRLPCRFNVLAD